MAVNSRSMLEGGCFLRGLTFDMSGTQRRHTLNGARHCAPPLCVRSMEGLGAGFMVLGPD